MKCKKIEFLIYLYKELNERERHQVDMHLNGCSSCKALFVQINNHQSLIRKADEIHVLAANPERIKRNIMHAIESSKISWMDKFILMINHYWLRTSLVIASTLLAGVFFAELSVDYPRTTFNPTTVASSIRLNTPKFLSGHVKRRESTNQISFYDCFKQSDCDFLKNLKTNKN